MQEKNNSKLKRILKTLFEYFMVGVGCVFMAVSFNIFCKPHLLAPGGFSGVAAILYYLFGLPVGAVTFILCLPWFGVLLKESGWKATLKSIYGTSMYSLAMDLSVNIPYSVDDIFLACVFGGICFGLSIGLVFTFKGTTGGTDLVAKVLHDKFTSISSGMWLLIIDGAIVFLGGFALGNIEISLYSAITVYISTNVINVVENGFDDTKAFYIISEKNSDIRDRIFERLDRGATFLDAKGAYSDDKKEMLLCLVNRFQISEMKSIIKETDPNAFVFSVDVNEVFGEGFEKER